MKKCTSSILAILLVLSLSLQSAPAAALADSVILPAEPGARNLLRDALAISPANRCRQSMPLVQNPGEPQSLRESIPPSAEAAALSQARVQSFDCAAIADVLPTECEALVEIYDSTNGAGWTNSTNWLLTNTVGDWFGITVVGGHVTSVNLFYNQLSGTIPAALGNLASLKSLNLSRNTLTGSIPAALGDLSLLESLSLAYNQLEGPIPPELGKLTALNKLWLDFNQLSGPIPAELGSLSNLQNLILSKNQLTGTIPAEIGGLTHLKFFYVWSNQLSGQLPPELGNLHELEGLYIHTNPLTGSIPLTFTNLVNLLEFGFYATSLCEPADANFQAWKSTVPTWTGTDTICKYEIYIPLLMD